MIPTSFDYVRADSLRDRSNALAAGDGTKVIAGGHSLLPIMKFRLAQPPRLVDISRLEELKGITEKRRGARIGAGTTYREVLDSALLRERFPTSGRGHRDHGRSAGPKPGHHRWRFGARRSRLRHARGHARARRHIQRPLQARPPLAQGPGVFSGSVHHGTGRRRAAD